jgi:hypothetical protein
MHQVRRGAAVGARAARCRLHERQARPGNADQGVENMPAVGLMLDPDQDPIREPIHDGPAILDLYIKGQITLEELMDILKAADDAARQD